MLKKKKEENLVKGKNKSRKKNRFVGRKPRGNEQKIER